MTSGHSYGLSRLLAEKKISIMNENVIELIRKPQTAKRNMWDCHGALMPEKKV